MELNKSAFFTQLETNFITYNELKTIAIKDNGEGLVSLAEKDIPYTTKGDFITPSTGDDIYVREALVTQLKKAQDELNALFDDCLLQVVYGYRSLKQQKETYQTIKQEKQKEFPNYDEDQLNEEIHRFIAVPSVAGHPTGGAVDVQLLKSSGDVVDMGTKAHEFTKESYSFNPFVTREVWLNRQKLRQAMLSAGFAPFDGEWWHYSYGDREWAAYYNKPFAIYTQIDF